MPLKAGQLESYELSPRSSKQGRRSSIDSDDLQLDELDPMKQPKAGRSTPYQDDDESDSDDAAKPLRGVFDPNGGDKGGLKKKKSVAWLEAGQSGNTARRWRFLRPSKFCCILIGLFFGTLFLLLSAGGFWVYKASSSGDGESEPWYPTPRGGWADSWKESYSKAEHLVSQMSLVEKVNITTGIGWSMGMCVGNTGDVERLGFPSLCLQDGPLGLRFADNATAWPAGVTVGATWNKDLMYQRGKAHGWEAKMKGVNVLLGPSMGPLGRLPAGGRNWEGFGADPVLQGVASANTIRGIQESGVIATAKHFALNAQEHFRKPWEWAIPHAISSDVDDRTFHEIYGWPFADSVRAGVGSVMCSYNQVNSSYACQNSKLLNGILKDEYGFQGFVQSDWLAQQAGVASALAGLDMTMPGDGLGWTDGKSLFGPELTKAVLNMSVPIERLNDMAMRVVAAWYQVGQDDKKEWPSVADGGGPNFSSWTNDEIGYLHQGSDDKQKGVVNKFVKVQNTTKGGDHNTLARKIASEGIVMVKNEGNMLPLSRNGSTIAAFTGKAKLGIFGEDAYANPDGNNACEDRSCNKGTLAMGWGSGAVELPYLVTPAEALLANIDDTYVDITEWKNNSIKGIEQATHMRDLCIVFASSTAGEGYLRWENVWGDRNNLHVQKGGDDLIEAVASRCPDVIVVVHTVGPVTMKRWIDKPNIKAVLVAHLPGQESGNALADVLFGDVSPSGHLPYTIGVHEEDYGPTSSVLYIPNGIIPRQNFSEGLYIDYRYFDKNDITPLFPFGHGLTYTTFELSEFSLRPDETALKSLYPSARPTPLIDPPTLPSELPDPSSALAPEGFHKISKYIYPWISKTSDVKSGNYPYPDGYSTSPHEVSAAGGGPGGNPDLYTTIATVSATLHNTGSRAGAAVVQLYVSLPKDYKSPTSNEVVDVPVRVLRGFDKVFLEPGERVNVEFKLNRRDWSYWDVGAQNWVVPRGEFEVRLGMSSRDEKSVGGTAVVG